MQWLVLSTARSFRFKSRLSVCSLHVNKCKIIIWIYIAPFKRSNDVPPVTARVFSCFLPLSKNMQDSVRLFWDSKFSVGVDECVKYGILSLYVSTGIHWWFVQGVPCLSQSQLGLARAPAATLKISLMIGWYTSLDNWMYRLMDWWNWLFLHLPLVSVWTNRWALCTEAKVQSHQWGTGPRPQWHDLYVSSD